MSPRLKNKSSKAQEVYFAYGSNLDKDRVKRRIGNTKCLGPAKLPGFKLGFAGESKTWDGAPTATLIEDPASVVYGVCYSLSPSQLKKMDDVEGKDYSRKKKETLLGEETISSWVYDSDDKIENTNPANKKYIYSILNAYVENGFPLTPLEPFLKEGKTKKRGKVLIRECIVVAGKASGANILGKTRDRNYSPNIKIVREIISGVEVVYMYDEDTYYMEGMNEYGVGIINSALMVLDDAKEKKEKIPTQNGVQIRHALSHKKLPDCTRALMNYLGGINGHTLIGNKSSLYSIESAKEYSPIITKLNPEKGFTIRTNHGEKHANAGYTPQGEPDDYLSSKIRKAEAEVALADVSPNGSSKDYEEIMPALTTQAFEKDSNHNMMRRTDMMRSTSQILMNLDEKEIILYLFPNEVTYKGVEDKTPDDYKPKIKVSIKEYQNK